MAGSDDKKKEGQQTPPETRLYSTPGADPNATIDSPASAFYSDPNLDALSERFALIKELGRGGMGVVYKARDKVTDEIVALKVLRPKIAQDPALIERFKNEVRLSKKITHKNVCRIFDLHLIGGTAAITMEFVEGETLRAWLRKNEVFAISRGTKLATQIISGLQEAHDQGVVHRDLKPENLMLTPEGNIKIMDFGIARSIAGSTTVTEGLTGTPAYMSPEQAEGKEIDHRTDIYSLGLILYEMFTGQMAFTGDTPVAVAFKQVHETPISPREVDPDLPPRIEKAILKCLEKKPKNRFQSVAELDDGLSDDVGSVVMQDALAEKDPAPAQHLSLWTTADWVLVALGCIGLLYFISFRDTVFPASKYRLEIDSITAQREVDGKAETLGLKLPRSTFTQLEFNENEYEDSVFSRILLRPRGSGPFDAFSELVQIDFPLRWKVNYSYVPAVWIRGLVREASDSYSLVDRQGSVTEIIKPNTSVIGLPNYRPPSLAERRELAKKTIEALCGAAPSSYHLIETVGGELNSVYSASWHPRTMGSSPWAEVQFRREVPELVRCHWKGSEFPPDLSSFLSEFRLGGKFFRLLFRLGLIFSALYLIGRVILSQKLRSTTIFWKWLPPALCLGFASVFVLTPAFTATNPSLPMLLGGGFAVSGLFVMLLVAVEIRQVRLMPGSISTYLRLMRGRIFETTVGLALFRGAFVGLILIAIETLLFHVSLVHASSNGRGIIFSVLANPAPIGHAIQSFSPPFYVICSAIVSGVVVGAIFMADEYAGLQHKPGKATWTKVNNVVFIFGMAMVYPLVSFGLSLPNGASLGIALGSLFALGLSGLILAGIMVKYDVLTVVMAIGTATVWSLNFPLLEILTVVGNSGQWAIFIAWGLLVVASGLIGFQAHVKTAFEAWKTES